jgi:ribose-phosphate pyrophosphokinase
MKKFKFPGGEVHVVLENNRMPYSWHLWNSDEIMSMLLAVDAYLPDPRGFHLTIPYVPYARQDRVTRSGEPLSARVMANIINALNALSVTIWDPHSDVITALINNCRVIHQHEIVENSELNLESFDGVIAPDAGAVKKAQKIADIFNVPLYQGHKQRDTATGHITGTHIIDHDGQLKNKGGHFLVPDDICDGGRTFIALAEALPPGCTADLYVTHGIFSQGVKILLDHFTRVYTANKHPDVSYEDTRFIEI